MSEVVYQWHPDVVADVREPDPKLGEHLDRRASTGDLSAYRKVKFGHDTWRGPSHRIVYRLLPDNYTPSRFRVIAVRSRADVYDIAAQRLEE